MESNQTIKDNICPMKEALEDGPRTSSKYEGGQIAKWRIGGVQKNGKESV